MLFVLVLLKFSLKRNSNSFFLMLKWFEATWWLHLFIFQRMFSIELINHFLLLHFRVLIGPHMLSSKETSQMWCNMPRKFMPVKAKQRQKVGGTNWLINTLTVKGRCFYRYFHILQCKKLTDFFNPSISNQMFLIISSVDNSDVAEGKQRRRTASNDNCEQLNK